MLQVYTDPHYAKHFTGPGHPERAERLAALAAGLEEGGAAVKGFLLPTPAREADLSAVHPPAYVELVRQVCALLHADDLGELPTGDTVISHDSYEVALLAAGGALAAARSATRGNPTFALIRPPGHHAEPARGMGFCIFNNIAIAASWALQHLGNVLIADFDYHHGNGTQAWVERTLPDAQAKLGFFSTHAYPAYPGTGAFRESQRSNRGFVVDIPLPHSTDTDDFVAVWGSLLPALAEQVKPKIILVSAGFDFLAGDPIAGLPVAPRAIEALSGLLGAVASQQNCSLALILEGGYSFENLRAAGASLAHIFGAHAGVMAAPAPAAPKDERLRLMTAEALGWFT